MSDQTRMPKLWDYVQAAMRRARYKLLPADEGYYGEIPGFPGLWANAAAEHECHQELESVLRSWIIVKLRHGDRDLPLVDGIDINDTEDPGPEVA